MGVILFHDKKGFSDGVLFNEWKIAVSKSSGKFLLHGRVLQLLRFNLNPAFFCNSFIIV